MAGYSGKPVAEKLGIRAETDVAILGAPAGYDELLGQLPPGVELSRKLVRQYDFIQTFVGSRSKLVATIENLKGHLKAAGALWVCWPKRTSGVKTDLDENVVREICLSAGLVDVKVAAIDATWSGLKFVYRVKERK